MTSTTSTDKKSQRSTNRSTASPGRRKKTAPPQSDAPPPGKFDDHVVCIGASAGGLDALERFFGNCPADTGAAFVVIQHLSPDHKSMMSNLLARHTVMPVTMVEEDMPIQANCVYLIPPGAVMHTTPGHLHLRPKNPHGLTLPIDIFFSSLAEVYGRKAVGVILSGTGTDGTRGAVAINAAGGFLMVQEPETAKFDGMPRSAIASGAIDVVLSAEELPGRLLAHLRNLPVTDPLLAAPLPAGVANLDVTAAILQLLHKQTGIDFSEYKVATILRRIERRMQIRRVSELTQYLELLTTDRAESFKLRQEMLIAVTSFFRDPETFELLAEKVIAPLVAKTAVGEELRVWTAGVATGEEAYTLAMLFLEAFEKQRRWPALKIFATDVEQSCIEMAGNGQFPESAAAELSPERLERFFFRRGDHFVVKNELRQTIVFARHNLLVDPPFTRMDLVVCRNTLIYFKAGAQERALHALQYAVKDGGALLLGSSETLSTAAEGMHVISAKHKIFRRTGPTSPPLLSHKAGIPTVTRTVRGLPGRLAGHATRQPGLADIGMAALMARYAPPSLVVNEAHEVVHLFGEVTRFFRVREGTASLELNRLLPEALVPVASALMYKVLREHAPLMSDGVSVHLVDGEERRVRLAAYPLEYESLPLVLLSFELLNTPSEQSHLGAVDVGVETVARVETLERELEATRESLQATIEELETSNEELQATNEELMASNEELQSSNEELQSVNEEMSTVNAEFQEKVHILNHVNADLESMAKAAGLATVFVDADMTITRFSPDAVHLFKLRSGDIGRRLDDIRHDLDYPGLMDDLHNTINEDRLIEREVTTRDGSVTYLVRLLPYSVPSSVMHGAVATFINVSLLLPHMRLGGKASA